jgi:DNA-binding transcriptional MerR regulator
MQKFTIKDIENMCGIKAHTLRIWEQRYDFFTPKRKQSQHRFYDNDDLKQLLRVAFLYHNGWKISKITTLSNAEIIEQVRTIEKISNDYQQYVLTLIEAAIDFDENAFSCVLNELTERFGLKDCILNICFPFLKRVGLLWMTNNVIPAQEHFSSYLIQHKIIAETQKLSIQPNAKHGILLFTPDGEHHELPLLFINYLLKLNSWRTIYLGAAIKLDHIKEVMEQDKTIDYLYMHSITNFTRYDIDDYIELLTTAFPEKKLVASGASIQYATRNFINVQQLKSDTAIQDFIYKNSSI